MAKRKEINAVQENVLAVLTSSDGKKRVIRKRRWWEKLLGRR